MNLSFSPAAAVSGVQAAYLRVGLLLLFALAAIVGFVFFLGGAKVRHAEHFETYFQESVQGLDVGSPVKYRGVTLGRVTETALVSATYEPNDLAETRAPTFRLVMVRFEVDADRIRRNIDAATAIQLGLRARLASQGLTGLSYVELDFVDPQRFPAQSVPWQPRDAYLPSMPSTIAQVQSAAERLVARLQGVDVERLAASVQQVLDDAHVELTSGDAHQTLAAATALLKTLDAGVEGADLPGTAADLKATSGAVRALAQGSQTRELLAGAIRAVDRLDDAAKGLPALLATLQATARRLDAGAADVQADLVPVLRDARAAASNLRETSEDLRRYPAGVLLGGPPPKGTPAR
jgi:paraquat-inducible protein B